MQTNIAHPHAGTTGKHPDSCSAPQKLDFLERKISLSCTTIHQK